MNKVILMGRLTRDPDIRYSQGSSMAVARYTLAVDRKVARSNDNNDQQTADFITCIVFGKATEFVEKYLKQGTKIIITGHIQTGSYTNKDGQRVYTTDVVVEEHEFAESRSSQYHQSSDTSRPSSDNAAPDGFMNIPEGVSDDELPFNSNK